MTVDDTAYELYTYLDKTADNYAKSVNKVADTLAGKSDVYDLVIPLSSGITFPDNLKDKISSSDQHDAMQKIQAKMDKHVKNVDVYDVLMQHRTEYEYFRTDHHWTTLGAYYAYTEFCKAKGITPESLDAYSKKQDFDGFLGSFYNDTSDAKLKANPDTCVRIPMIGETRSLNLSNSVAIVLYEALRQNDFDHMKLEGQLHRLSWDD